ncbi:MAG TPA: hypothetical protein VJ732_11320 [Bryobacteraceae bacterium]|nr:hypothetical protein [Bryobacteraceae bacterium]
MLGFPRFAGALIPALAVLSIASPPADAQGVAQKAGAARSWTAPRTADNQPDLQGVWTNATLTPLERPAELAGKEFLTAEEAAQFEKQTLARVSTDRRDGPPEVDVGRSYNEFWRDRGTSVIGSRRTSLIVDPPDGKIPPLTAAAQHRQDEIRAHARLHPADGPEDRSLWERCLTRGIPMVPGPYNNDFQIVQGPGYVVIFAEMIHEARVIPLDGRPHAPSAVRQWLGDSRGHWEGDTLVVDTTNFSPEMNFRGSNQNLHLVERFTRLGPDNINYEFTVEDPTTFTKAWSAEIPMRKTDGPIFEYACHEGNYALGDILRGARAEEKKAEAAKNGSN